jgi:hypothetical protein
LTIVEIYRLLIRSGRAWARNAPRRWPILLLPHGQNICRRVARDRTVLASGAPVFPLGAAAEIAALAGFCAMAEP